MRSLALVAMVYGTVGVMGSTLIDTPGDLAWTGGWYAAVAALVGSITIVVRMPTRRHRWLTALGAFVVIMIAWPGWFVLANAAGGPGESVTVAGEILERRATSGKTSSHSVRIRDETTGRLVRLTVSAPEYDALNVGDRFSRTYHRGWLGVPYRWRL